jgi:hypothetical protein
MGGQFDLQLKLGPSAGDPFDATGPFDWDDCYVMSIFIYQSEGQESAAASMVGKPTLAPDPSNPGQPRWTLQVKGDVPNPPENTLTRALKPGPALAVAAALITSAGNVKVEQWGQAITLV